MKARTNPARSFEFLHPQIQKAILEAAKEIAGQQIEDAAIRAQRFWMLAMLKRGLSVKTIEGCRKELAALTVAYEGYVRDGLADFAVERALRDAGVDVTDELREET